MWGFRKKVVFLCLAVAVGGGFMLLLVTAVAPGMVLSYPLVLTLLKLWFGLISVLVVWLLVRIRRSDVGQAMRRKDKYEHQWRRVETLRDQGIQRRVASYSRESILQARQQSERRAREAAEEREGVRAVFKPERATSPGE